MNGCLVRLFEGEENAAPETVANSLVDLIQTTATVVAEDEQKVQKKTNKEANARRTSMRRASLPEDMGASLNMMFGFAEDDATSDDEEEGRQESTEVVAE